MEEKVYYIYRHLRRDNGQVFYIGRGKHKENATSFQKEYNRAFLKCKSHRSSYWINIFNKVGREVEIMIDNLTQDESIEKEKEFIKLYGRVKNGGILCNLTDGGEYFNGREFSDEERKQIKVRCHSRRKGRELPPEWREKIRQSMKIVRQNKTWSSKSTEETRARAQEKLKKAEDLKKLAETFILPPPAAKIVKDKSQYEKPGPDGLPIICLNTGFVFDNSVEVIKAMFPLQQVKTTNSCVLRACHNNTKYKGFTFQFL